MRDNESGDDRSMARRLSRRSWLAGVRGNALARRTDRRQAALRVLCTVLWVIALPVAIALGAVIAVSGVQAAATQTHDRKPATAVLLADAPKVTMTANGTPVIVSTGVAARWIAADGVGRTGVIEANSGAVAGTRIPIWVDRSGRPVDPPVSSGAAVGMAVVIGGGGWVGLGVLLLMTLRVTAAGLDRRRRRDWDRDWARVAPLWLHQE